MRSFLLFSALVFALPLSAADLDWPEITSQTKPWSRWWWLGNIGTKADFTSEMEKYAKAGLGGLEITPIYGVRGEEKRFTNYLSPEWMAQLDHVLDEGQRLGLGIDMSTGTGWPFGGPWVTPDTSARHVVRKTFSVKGGERLAELVTATDEPAVRVAGPRRVEIAELKDPVASNANQQDLSLDQVRFPRRLVLQALVAHSATGEKIPLTDKVDSTGRLDWVAPAGVWNLYAIFLGWHGKQVERAGPGGEGDAIDHFSSAALAHYLKKFDDAYAGHKANRLRAYFNDSYEVDDATGESNWTPRFFAEFQRRRGYDLRDELPAFFGKDTADKNARVMADHRETISDLLLEEFTVPWAKWAKTHRAIIRNQAHGSPANIIDLYAASDIPETEGTNVVGMKLASSAAHVTGKPLTSAETATWLDEHWVSTLGDIKRRVDTMFLGGVNHNCYHGTVFSPPGEPWPGHHFYASVELDPSNAIWADFDALNAYVARTQSFLQAGKPANDILLYYPIHDVWAQRGNGAMPHFGSGGGGAARGGNQNNLGQDLLNRGYTFDFVTDRLLAGVTFAEGSLQSGGNRYRVIVVPETKFMPLETLERLYALADAGATVVFHKNLPDDVSGLGKLMARRSEFQVHKEAIKRGTPRENGITELAWNRGRVLLGDDMEKLLTHARVARESFVDQGIRFERRTLGGGFVYFLLNSGNAPVEGWFPLSVGAKGAALFDPMTAASGVAAIRTAADRTEVFLKLAPGETVIVKTFAAAPSGSAYSYWNAAGSPQPLQGTWSVKFTAGGPALPAEISSDELKSWTEFAGDAYKSFSGTAVYRLAFARPAGDAAAWQLDLGKVAESARVKLNGRELGVLFTPPFHLVIPRDQLQAQNTLEVSVTSLSANRIADLDRRDPSWKKFYNTNYPARIGGNRGPDGNFSAAKWTPRASGLIGPVTLAPVVPAAIR
ncbi:MAG TPA: glycosyl hydrolase [Opitutaceae bacterium]|nr:glycosyl hydrolase [Opitutaceae bacterium]